MECYKITGKETEDELNAIYLQIIEDYYEYGTCSVIERSKLD